MYGAHATDTCVSACCFWSDVRTDIATLTRSNKALHCVGEQ